MGFSQKRKVLLAETALLATGAIWGSGFVVMKNTLDALPVHYLLSFRFTIAAAALAIALFPRFVTLGKREILSGAACGLFLYGAYAVQTYGLSFTTAGKNAFLTSVYVVLVPFLSWAAYRRRPARRDVFAALLCMAGVGIVALDADFTVNIGDVLTLLCGLLYGVHIVAVSAFTAEGQDVMTLTMLQFIFAALCGWIAGGLFEPFPAAAFAQPDTLFSLLYLGLACTLLALTLQNVGLKYAPAAHASLLMSTEAPFGCLFGILLLNEPFTLRFAVGFLVIFASILVSQLGTKDESATG